MACPQQNNIGAKRTEKWTKYKQLAFETREQHPGYEIYVVLSRSRSIGQWYKSAKRSI